MNRKTNKIMDYFHFKHYRIDGMSNDESIFFSNIFSWAKSKKFKEPVYKSDKEMSVEINCTIKVVAHMRAKFVRNGLLKIGKRENLKFNGATPYFLDLEKIQSINNSEILREIKKITRGGVPKTTIASPKNDYSLSPKPGEGVPKTTTSYTEQNTQQNTQQKNPLPPYEGGVADAPDVFSSDSLKGEEKRDILPDGFPEWWALYPEKKERLVAIKAYKATLKLIKPDELLKRTQNYLDAYHAKKSSGVFVPNFKNPATWLNQRIWDEDEHKIVKLKELSEAEQRAEMKEMIKRIRQEESEEEGREENEHNDGY